MTRDEFKERIKWEDFETRFKESLGEKSEQMTIPKITGKKLKERFKKLLKELIKH